MFLWYFIPCFCGFAFHIFVISYAILEVHFPFYIKTQLNFTSIKPCKNQQSTELMLENLLTTVLQFYKLTLVKDDGHFHSTVKEIHRLFYFKYFFWRLL